MPPSIEELAHLQMYSQINQNRLLQLPQIFDSLLESQNIYISTTNDSRQKKFHADHNLQTQWRQDSAIQNLSKIYPEWSADLMQWPNSMLD